MFYLRLAPLLLLALSAYCVLDVIATDDSRVRNLPKLPWVFIVIFFTPIGPIAWLLLGRPEGAGFAVGGTRPRRQAPPTVVDGPEHFVTGERPVMESRDEAIARWEAERKRRAEELERRERELMSGSDDDDPGTDDGPASPPDPDRDPD